MQDYVPLNDIHILTISHCTPSNSFFLMQGFETGNTVQICIEHGIKEREFRSRLLLQNYVPANDIHVHILTISHCSYVHVSAIPHTVFDAGIQNLQHSSDMH